MKTMEKEKRNSLQVGAGPVKLKNVNKPLFGHYESVHVEPKRYLTEFTVTEDAFLPVGMYCVKLIVDMEKYNCLITESLVI